MEYLQDLIKQIADKAGISKEEAQKSIDMLPVISEQEFNNLVKFLETLTKTITDLLELNYSLTNKTEELERTARSLDDSLKAFQNFIDITEIGAFLTDFYSDELLINNNEYREFMNDSSHSWEQWKEIDKNKLLDDNGDPHGSQTVELYNKKTECWYMLKLRALRWIENRLAVMTTIADITERKNEEQKMQYLAYYDQKLKIPNGMKLQRDLQKYSSENLFIICFDTRSLREINNVYGRDIGDLLLKSIADWISGLTGPDVRLYRFKGNEFALLMKNHRQNQVEAMAADIYRRFDQAWMVDVGGIRQRVFSGTRIGVLQMVEEPDSYENLINLMERVLIAASKAEGPIFYDGEKNEEFQRDIRLQVSLKACVLNNMEGFSLNYQPVVDTCTGKWVAMEALCRWNSPQLGNIPPGIFIEKAEQLGYITAISQWVFEEAISQTKKWKLDEADNFRHISINLSPIQLRDRELLPKFIKVLEAYDFPVSKLVLEITETAEVSFDKQTIELLKAIKQAGISLAIDDFGNGYSSFLNLKHLPVDMLKTDRSFVDGIEQDEFLQKTMRIIVEYAHAVGLSVTVEGVENEKQRDIIEQNQANLIQGYFFSHPLSVAALSEKIHKFWN
ncbi:MAG: EAL domain-containing protein [Lachnospiraceae bacterium]